MGLLEFLFLSRHLDSLINFFARGRMQEKIRISCKVSDFLPLEAMQEFQGNLKRRTKLVPSAEIFCQKEFSSTFCLKCLHRAKMSILSIRLDKKRNIFACIFV
jgi:hypothetical protein